MQFANVRHRGLCSECVLVVNHISMQTTNTIYMYIQHTCINNAIGNKSFRTCHPHTRHSLTYFIHHCVCVCRVQCAWYAWPVWTNVNCNCPIDNNMNRMDSNVLLLFVYNGMQSRSPRHKNTHI